jgi:hypothetical protein
VWAEAAKWLGKFNEAVLTVLDSDGYPGSVRVDPRAYDPATGELSAALPDALRAVEGPANLMCHYHDEKMWNIKAIQIKGQIENRDGTWMFVSSTFKPPAKLAFWSFVKGARASAQKYLDKRSLDRPAVNWAPIKEIQRRVKAKDS